MPSLNHARSEQLRCAEQYHDAGARLGLFDWFTEEFLMMQSKPAIGSTHTIYWHPRWALDPWGLTVEVIGTSDAAVFIQCKRGKDSIDLDQWARAVEI